MAKHRLNCDNCGQFTWKYPSHISGNPYCNMDCYQESRNEKQEYICDHCGDVFLEYPSNRKHGSYCDADCYQNSRNEKIEFECFNCGKSFENYESQVKNLNKPFCSNKCYGESKNLYPNTSRLRKLIMERNRKREMRESLSNNYVREVILQQVGRDYIPSEKEIVLKRVQLMAHRQANNNLKLTAKLCQNVNSQLTT